MASRQVQALLKHHGRSRFYISARQSDEFPVFSKMGILAMRMGPGKHLKGRSLMGGLVEPEKASGFPWSSSIVLYIPASISYFWNVIS